MLQRGKTVIYSIYHARGPLAGFDSTVMVRFGLGGSVVSTESLSTISAFDAAEVAGHFTNDDISTSRLSATAFKKLYPKATW